MQGGKPTTIGPAAVADFLDEQAAQARAEGSVAAAVVFVTRDGLATYSWRLPSNRNNGASYLALVGATSILASRLADFESNDEGGAR